MLTSPKILVCSDFSSFSDMALKAAEVIRKKTNGTLHVLHVSDIPPHWDWTSSGLMTTYLDEKQDLSILNMLQKRLTEQLSSMEISAQAHFTFGYAYSVIHQFIKDEKIDLIIMGRKGKSETPFHIGSLTQKMVPSTNIPILVIKKPFVTNLIAGLVDPFEPKKHIVDSTVELAYLFNARSEIVSLVHDIAPRFIGIGNVGVSTELLSMSEQVKLDLVKKIKEQITRLIPPQSKMEINVLLRYQQKTSDELNSFLAAEKTDLVVMERHQKRFVEKMLLGSDTRRMLELFEGNLLILPPTHS